MVFQFTSYPYYLNAEAEMKRELERKEQEKKRSPKVEFITGGVQPPISASIPKIPGIVNMKQSYFSILAVLDGAQPPFMWFYYSDVCYIYSALAGVSTLPVPTEGLQKETRPNKKSKWDKVFNQPL